MKKYRYATGKSIKSKYTITSGNGSDETPNPPLGRNRSNKFQALKRSKYLNVGLGYTRS